MTVRNRGARRIPLLIAHLWLGLCLVSASFAAADPTGATLDISVQEDAYNTTVRIASTSEMHWPVLVADLHPESPRYGTVYAIGTRNLYLPSNVSQPPPDCSVVVVATSLDGGRTFGVPAGPDTCFVSNPPWLLVTDAVVGNDGALYILGPVFPWKSMDGGASWQALNSTPVRPDALAVDPVSGRLYVGGLVPARYGISPMLLRLASSEDGGLTWSSPLTLFTSNDTSDEPLSLAAYGGLVVAAFPLWPLNVSERPIIVAAYSTDAGVRLSRVNVSVPGVGFLITPKLAVSPSGVFAMAWSQAIRNETSPETYDFSVFSAVSQDGGVTFLDRVPVADGESPASAFPGVPLVIDDDSRIYVSWANSTHTVFVAVSNSTSGGFDRDSFTSYFEYRDVAPGPSHRLARGPRDTVLLSWYAERWVTDPSGTSVLDANASGAYVRTLSGSAGGTVSDPSGSLLASEVRVQLRDPAGNRMVADASWTGSPIGFEELRSGAYELWLVAGNVAYPAGPVPVEMWGKTAFEVHVHGTPSGRFIAIVGTTVVLIGGGTFAALHYTRITREGALEGRARVLIYQYILQHPGSTYSDVRGALGLKNGVASYHLAVLEKQGLIHSEARRRRRWYYPNGDVSLWRELPVSRLQGEILNHIRDGPGIGVRELARAMDRRVSTVSYNVKALERENLVRTTRQGRKLHCFLSQMSEAA